MVHQFANWFKKLRTHIGVYLAREEVDGLRDYSFAADERAYDADERARAAKHELDTSKEWQLLVSQTMRASHDWRDELSRKLHNAYAEYGLPGTAADREAYYRSEIAASIVYKIIRDALHGYTVDFQHHTDPESGTDFGRFQVDTINFKNGSYVSMFSTPK